MYPVSLLPIVSAFLVFPIWAIEQFLPFPWIVEELAKYLFLLLFIKQHSKNTFLIVILSGISFGFSEAIFYQIDALQMNSIFNTFLNRLVFTIPMHVLTYIFLYLGINKGKSFAIISVIIAITIHYLFNLAVTGMI